MQGTWVQSLVWETFTCHRATKAHEPQLLSPHTASTKACAARACAPRQEKPPQWDTHPLLQRAAPAHCTRESLCTAMKTQHNQKKGKKDGLNLWMNLCWTHGMEAKVRAKFYEKKREFCFICLVRDFVFWNSKNLTFLSKRKTKS